MQAYKYVMMTLTAGLAGLCVVAVVFI